MAKLNTVVALLVAGKAVDAAASFATLTMAEMKTVRNTFNEMYSNIKTSLEAAEAEAAAAEQAKADALAKAIADIQAAFDGLDLEVATEMAKKALGWEEEAPAAKGPKGGKTWTYEKVLVEYNGTRYEMPRNGNMPEALKNLVTNAGYELKQRGEFIEKYKVAE